MATSTYCLSLALLVSCNTPDSRPTDQNNNNTLGEDCRAFGTLLQAPDSTEPILLNSELTGEAQRRVIEQRFRHDMRSTGQFVIQLHVPVTVGEGLIVTAVRGEIDWYEPHDIIRHEQRLDIEVGPKGLVICEGQPATMDQIAAVYRSYLATPFESYSTVINLNWDQPPLDTIETLMHQLVQVYWSSLEFLAKELHGKPLCSLPNDLAIDLSSERPFRIRVLSPVSPPPPPPTAS